MPEKKLLDIINLSPLERHALLNSLDERKKAFFCYLAMREKIGCDFLDLINSREPYMNDHSKKHLERVLAHIESILKFNFPNPKSDIEDIHSNSLITWIDTLILLNGLVWHDIGNIYGRNGHAEKVHECFEAISAHLYEETLGRYIKQVAMAHSGNGAIEKKIPASHAFVSYQGENINLQFLAATLRFADEIDEDQRRANPQEWDELKLIPYPEKHRYWFFSKSNSSIKVEHEKAEFGIKFWVTIDSHIPQSEFSKKFVSDGSEIDALTEYFRRIIKINKERNYCNKYFRRAYYHSGIYGIRVRLSTYERNTTDPGKKYFLEISDNKDIDCLISDQNLSDIHKYISDAKALGE